MCKRERSQGASRVHSRRDFMRKTVREQGACVGAPSGGPAGTQEPGASVVAPRGGPAGRLARPHRKPVPQTTGAARGQRDCSSSSTMKRATSARLTRLEHEASAAATAR